MALRQIFRSQLSEYIPVGIYIHIVIYVCIYQRLAYNTDFDIFWNNLKSCTYFTYLSRFHSISFLDFASLSWVPQRFSRNKANCRVLKVAIESFKLFRNMSMGWENCLKYIYCKLFLVFVCFVFKHK